MLGMKSRTIVFLLFVTALTLPPRLHAQSEEARVFFRDNLLIDGLCFPYYRPGSTLNRFVRGPEGTFDMAEFRSATGVDIAIWDIRTPQEMAKMVRGVELGHFTNVRIIRDFEDVEKAFEKKRHGWLFATQHPWRLGGSVDPIETWYKNGLRMLQIVYGSSIPVLPDERLGTGSSGGDSESGGLTEMGRKVVEECNRVGIIVDVSHCSRQTTLDVAEVAKRPITATHAGCEAITNTKRNKSDEEIRAIARTGGVFGITPIKFMISDGSAEATMEDFIHHLEHAIKVAGIDHVGIAADLKRNGVPEDESIAYTCPELNSQERWFHLFDALKAKGYPDEDLVKIFGTNFLRVLKMNLDGADSRGQ